MQDIKHGKVILKLDQVVKAHGISISKLAYRAEMQRTQLKSYMKNEVQRVDLDILARLCHALECDITDLLEYKKEQP